MAGLFTFESLVVLHREHARRGKDGEWKKERDRVCEEEGG